MIASVVLALLFKATKMAAGSVDRLQTDVAVIPQGQDPPVVITQTLDANRRIEHLNALLSTASSSIAPI